MFFDSTIQQEEITKKISCASPQLSFIVDVT